jgi:hypothetical protein
VRFRGRRRTDAEQTANLGVLALDVAQLTGERVRLDVDRAQLVALRGRLRLQCGDPRFFKVELPSLPGE